MKTNMNLSLRILFELKCSMLPKALQSWRTIRHGESFENSVVIKLFVEDSEENRKFT
jgi:hypothetical protein